MGAPEITGALFLVGGGVVGGGVVGGGAVDGWPVLEVEPLPPSSPPQPDRIIAVATTATNLAPDSSLMAAPLRIWQPRYPRRRAVDRRLCVPALRRVCY
jgi:hypothetical protein